jgi:hypothetical protein
LIADMLGLESQSAGRCSSTNEGRWDNENHCWSI